MSYFPMTRERQLAVDLSHRRMVREAELAVAEAVERLGIANHQLLRGEDPLEELLIEHIERPSGGERV